MRLLILAFAFCVHAQVVDRIVAIVGKEPILASQLKAGQTLENLIDDEVIYQEVKKLGLDVSEAEIDLTISNIMKQNKLNQTDFEKALLQTSNMTLSEYRDFLKKQFFKRNLIQSKVKNRVSSKSSSEVRLQAEQAIFKTQEQALEAIAGANIEFSDIGTISKHDLIPEFAQIVFSLQEGETSRPLKSKDGFVVIRVKKRFEIPLEKVDKQRYEQEVETAFKRYVKELRASAYIEEK